jgi:superfamily II DNA or RNA helicase
MLRTKPKTPVLSYLQKGVKSLLKQGRFDNGWFFRTSQRESLEAYDAYLHRTDLTDAEKLRGFFEMPTGVGKTAVFVAIITAAQKAAQKDGQTLNTKIIVPTIQLLEQTQKSFHKFAPSQKNNIGLYGDGEKNLSHPITIMTYNAWVDLTETGEISAKNTDILIFDEAHRGTSGLRVDLFDAFDDGKTCCIAFTATAHFDEEKSVEQTHKRQIYYKSLPDAVRSNELAHYIHTQFYVIRVEPKKKAKSEFEDAATGKKKNNYVRRQKAWNQRAVIIFSEGTDRLTGDKLSDNQAGFFVADTPQADHLEKLLNTNRKLAHKAAAMGCKSVAVAIHSHMSPKKQKQRMEDYQAGKYMAVIGDEKFKEGFDHEPMKTIIDWPHGSLVDKRQILGRGARQCKNPRKNNRDEGLAFIDTIVYVGSNDPDEDALLRGRAIRNAVLAIDILEEAVVLSPGKMPQLDYPPALKNKPEKIKGQSIEEYTDLVRIHDLLKERSRLRREHVIEITEEMRQHLIRERERTGVGPRDFLKKRNVPNGLTEKIIGSWLSNASKTADREHWNWVINLYNGLPSKIITQQMRQQLLAEKTRTGAGATTLLETAGMAPEGLTKNMIDHFISGSSATVDPKHWSWLMGAYEALPDKFVVTKQMAKMLRDEMKRTATGAKQIANQHDSPKSLRYSTINNWAMGYAKSANPEHWNWVMKIYKAFPDAKKNIPFTKRMHASLIKERERTEIGPTLILQTTGVPTGLTIGIIGHLLSRKSKTVNSDYWNWVMDTYKKLPSKNQRPKPGHGSGGHPSPDP